MTAVFCRNAADREAETWARELEPFVALESAVSDAAEGITKAMADAAEARGVAPAAPPLEHGPEAEIAAAVNKLADPGWAKVRNVLEDRRSLAFLDRMRRRLESAEPRREWRAAMAWRWWLRHGRPSPSDPVTELVRAVGRDRVLTAEEQASYDRVAPVQWDTCRAGSAVECMNSVLRMQQSRHRRMTQPMLDLKRLYWNCRAFRSGPRKDLCPYRGLGLDLPTFDFWELLQTDPARLTQELSTQGDAV